MGYRLRDKGWKIGWVILLFLSLMGFKALAEQSVSPMAQVVSEIMSTTAASDATQGNRVLNIENGYDALLLRVHLIRQAQRSIEIQAFIWKNDESGRLMIYELVEAARRGVRVRVIADHMVSDQDPAIGAFLSTASPNLEVRHYRPIMAQLKPSFPEKLVSMIMGFRRVNQRMHNKLMVVDGQVMLTGGRNIENTYFNHSTSMNFRDRDVLAVGPVAREAEVSFEEYWNFRHTIPSAKLKDVAAVIEKGKYPRYESRDDYDFGGYFTELTDAAGDDELMRSRFWDQLRSVDCVEFIVDKPGKGSGFFSKDSRTTKEMMKRIGVAQREVLVQSPYLILSRTARRVIRKLEKNRPELEIRVSTNSYASTDNIMAYSANYRMRSDYVEKLDLQIFEFKPHPDSLRDLFPEFDAMAQRAAEQKNKRPPFLCIHAKSMVVDEKVTFIGSYNLDPRSASLNTEVGLMIEDEAFARDLRRQIQRDMAPKNSWVIARREFPLGLIAVNSLVEGILAISPIDVWPIQNTSSFELKPDADSVAPDDPRFYENYRDVGGFPGSDGLLTPKEILTHLYKTVGAPFTPVM